MTARRPRGEDDEEASGGGADDHRRRHGPRRTPAAMSFPDVTRAVLAETIRQALHDWESSFRLLVREELRNIISQNGHIPPRDMSQTVTRRCSARYIQWRRHIFLPWCQPGSLPLYVQEEFSTPLKLVFGERLKIPIFTHNKLVDAANNTLKIKLADKRTDEPITPPNTLLGSSVRLEVLVLDGDFRCEEGDSWTADQFSAAIVKAREGKRPLLVGTLNMQLSNYGVATIDDVSFTDNSSWIRSRKFRIGVRVMLTSYCGPRIQEAVSESFTVKDHRGELYQKHYPPSLRDEVWRLVNIGKDGPIHKRLESEGIQNVQDFLMLNTVDPNNLRTLLAMSDRQWRKTLSHSKTCDLRGKFYVFKSEGHHITFNPIGEVLTARIGDRACSFHELNPEPMHQVKQLAIQAYQQWDQLEEVTTNMMPPSTTETNLTFHQERPTCASIVPARNSGWEPSESQESIISSGTQKAKNPGSTGAVTSSAAEAVTTNCNSTSDSAAAVPAPDSVVCWSPLPTDVHFIWPNSMDWNQGN
ncbi:hypothetical protein ACP4OV_027736 [Aristida adscensionis]